jgi:hypothetical protein
MRSVLVVAVAAVMSVIACAGSSPAASGPTVSGVAVQSSDLPSGMVRCNITGSIDDFVKAEQSPDPNTAKTISDYWTDAKSNGAKAAYVALYTDSQSRCADIKNPQTDVGTATYKLVVNFVVQFKDEASAVDAYKNKSIFGFSAAQLRTAPTVEGKDTGLTDNSIVLNQAIGDQSFYIADWQNKTFLIILAVLNVDATSSKKVSTAENSRIK